jgi:hypothetical protein
MTAQLQIGTDPTCWYLPPSEYDTVAAGLAQPGTPIAVDVLAPLQGRLVLSPRAAGSVALTLPVTPVGWVPGGICKPTVPLLRLPSSAGPTHDNPGYLLAADTDVAALEQKLIAAMSGPESVVTLALDVPAPGKGVLRVSGATLTYAVLCRATAPG